MVKNIITSINKGNTLTIGLRFNPEYDQSNLVEIKLYAAQKEQLPLTKVGEYYRAEFTSEQTFNWYPPVEITAAVIDANFGLKKYIIGCIDVDRTVDGLSNQTINNG
jgi:hypothetical protein